MEIIIEISIFAIVTLIVLVLHHFIIEDKEIYATRKEIEEEKAKYRGLLINSIKEFEEISRIKYPKYYHEYTDITSLDDTIDIKPQKLTILKRIEDGLLLIKCVSDCTRCEFYVDIHGEIYLEDTINPIGEYEKIREFTFETEDFYDYLRK